MSDDLSKMFEFIYSYCGEHSMIQVVKHDWKSGYWPNSFFKVGDWEGLAKFAEAEDAKGNDLYFRVTPIDMKSAASLKFGERGKAELASALPCLWADIDLDTPEAKGHHKDEKLPTSIEEAMSILSEAKVPEPNIVVNSGGGLHVYWVFANPLLITNDASLKQATDLSRKFHLHIIKVFKQHGYSPENTADLARVLRIPGTHNRKKGCAVTEVKLLSLNDKDFLSIDMVKEAIDAQPEPCQVVCARHVEKVPVDDGIEHTEYDPAQQRHFTPEEQHTIMDACGVLRSLIANMANQTEPQWFTTVQLLVNLGVSDAEIHALSSKYDGYDAEECAAKIKAAKEHGYVLSCQRLREDFPGCCDCGLKVGALTNHLLLNVAKARKQIDTAISNKQKLTDATLASLLDAVGALRVAGLEIEAADATQRIQKLSGLSKKKLEQIIDASFTEQLKEAPVLPEVISSALKYNFKMPGGYVIDVNNALVLGNRKVPIVLAESVFVPESVRLEESKGMIANLVGMSCLDASSLVRSSVYVGEMLTKVNELINRGFRINVKARDYLPAWVQAVAANNLDIPKELAVNKLGWTSDGLFFLPSDIKARKIVDPITLQDVTEKFTPKGKLEDFVALIKKVEVVPEVRAVLATALASPLVSRLPGCRPWILHLYGQSRSGKTAAAALANALFLPKQQGMIRFDSTNFAIETTLGQNRHIMTVINESELFKSKYGQTMDEGTRLLIYRLAEGQSYQAGTKSGSLRIRKDWDCTIVTTGEHPLLSDNGGAGSRTRCMELKVSDVIIPEELGPEIYAFIEGNYGTAGAAYIKAIKEITIPVLAVKLAEITKGLREQKVDARYANFLALMMLSYGVFANEILGFSEEEVNQKTSEMVSMFINRYDISLDVPEWERIRDKLRDYLNAYSGLLADSSGRFPGFDEGKRPHHPLGWYANGSKINVAMFPQAFNIFCKNEIPELSKRAIRKELVDHGIIIKDEKTGRSTMVMASPLIGIERHIQVRMLVLHDVLEKETPKTSNSVNGLTHLDDAD